MRFSKMTVVVAAVGFLFAVSAWAGKAEREKKTELEPMIKTTIDNIKTSCGCTPSLNVAWDTFKTVDNMYTISRVLENIQDASKEVCGADKEGKKVYCNGLKSMMITYKGKSAGKCADKTCTFEVGDNEYDDSVFR